MDGYSFIICILIIAALFVIAVLIIRKQDIKEIDVNKSDNQYKFHCSFFEKKCATSW